MVTEEENEFSSGEVGREGAGREGETPPGIILSSAMDSETAVVFILPFDFEGSRVMSICINNSENKVLVTIMVDGRSKQQPAPDVCQL